MLHEKGRHAEPRRIADAEAAAQGRVELPGAGAASQLRHMLDEIESEQADEVDGEHLGAEGTGQFRTLPDPVAVGDAEFAVAVDRGGAHQIADRLDRGRVGLAPRGERGEHVIEEAHAAVGASEHELGRKIAPGLLSRHVPFEARDLLLVGHTVEEHEGRVPCFRDHAIRALLGRELVTEGDEAVGSALGLDRVDRRADTARVEIEAMRWRSANACFACAATRPEGSSASSDVRCRADRAASPHPEGAAKLRLAEPKPSCGDLAADEMDMDIVHAMPLRRRRDRIAIAREELVENAHPLRRRPRAGEPRREGRFAPGAQESGCSRSRISRRCPCSAKALA